MVYKRVTASPVNDLTVYTEQFIILACNQPLSTYCQVRARLTLALCQIALLVCFMHNKILLHCSWAFQFIFWRDSVSSYLNSKATGSGVSWHVLLNLEMFSVHFKFNSEKNHVSQCSITSSYAYFLNRNSLYCLRYLNSLSSSVAHRKVYRVLQSLHLIIFRM